MKKKFTLAIVTVLFLMALVGSEDAPNENEINGHTPNEVLQEETLPDDTLQEEALQEVFKPQESTPAATDSNSSVIAANDDSSIYKVINVVDGDTIDIDLNGKTRVRLIGVDTPESVHPDADRNIPYGDISSAYTESKLLNRQVTIELDVQEKDRYGRLLAYIWLDEGMFNKTLLDEGHAKVATYPPNVKYVDTFVAAEKVAQSKGLGLWAYDSSEQPQPGDSNEQSQPSDSNDSYIGNNNSRIFHRPDCASIADMEEHNKVDLSTRAEAISGGFTPCKNCNP